MSQTIYGLTYDFVQQNGHYLVIELEEGSERLSSLALKMMKSTTIPRLLPLHVERWNLSCKLYYSLASRRMLGPALTGAAPERHEFYRMLYNIAAAVDDSRLYMLNDQRYILHEDLMFVGKEYGDVFLVYVPLQELRELPPPEEQMRGLIRRLSAKLGQEGDVGVLHLLGLLEREGHGMAELKANLRDLLYSRNHESGRPETEKDAAWGEPPHLRPAGTKSGEYADSGAMRERGLETATNISRGNEEVSWSGARSFPGSMADPSFGEEGPLPDSPAKASPRNLLSARNAEPRPAPSAGLPIDPATGISPGLGSSAHKDGSAMSAAISGKNRAQAAFPLEGVVRRKVNPELPAAAFRELSLRETLLLLLPAAFFLALIWSRFADSPHEAWLYIDTGLTLLLLDAVFVFAKIWRPRFSSLLPTKRRVGASAAMAPRAEDLTGAARRAPAGGEPLPGADAGRRRASGEPAGPEVAAGPPPGENPASRRFFGWAPPFAAPEAALAQSGARPPAAAQPQASRPAVPPPGAPLSAAAALARDEASAASAAGEASVYYASLAHKTTLLAPPQATVLLAGAGVGASAGTPPVPTRTVLEVRTDGRTEKVPLGETTSFMIGRGPAGVQYVCDEAGVSRTHAEILRDGGQYLVRDLGSRNGSFLNGEFMVPYKLYPFREGDSLTIVKSEFLLKIE